MARGTIGSGGPEERGEVAGHMNRRVGGDGAGEHPHQADATHVRVRCGLHDLGEKGSGRIARQAVAGLALLGEHLGQLVFGRGREPGGDDLQQLDRADPGAAAHRDHREERRARDGLFEIVDQHGLIDLLAAEVPLHQCLVLGLLDDSLDQAAPHHLDRLAIRGVIGFMGCGALTVGVLEMGLGEKADESGARLAGGAGNRNGFGGQIERQHLVAERVLRGGQRVLVVRAGVVEFRDENGAWHADLAALQPQRLGRLVDLLVGRDDEQRAVGGSQPRTEFADEIGVARRIDQIDLHAVVYQRRQRETDRALLRDLRLVAIADGRSVDDRPGSVQHAGSDQQRLDECGLAATRWAHQHHIPDGGRTVRGGRA